MGWAETEHGGGRCRKHPSHGEAEGVCSFCVTERLAKLSSFNQIVAAGSCSPSLTNSPPCSSVSPGPRGHNRNTSDVMGSMSFIVSVSNGLKKSRSVAYVSTDRVGEAKKKRGGFWSKLLRSSRKRSKEAMH